MLFCLQILKFKIAIYNTWRVQYTKTNKYIDIDLGYLSINLN